MPANDVLDLTLYLVTDSTPAILGHQNLLTVVREALEGGVTIVQYRDKHADTALMIDTARRLHQLTRQYDVPLLINDRIDVCVAAGAEGVHLGQDDMNAVEARNFLPPGSIIGVTASSVKEANKAIAESADYLGIGTMFGTPTKEDTKSIIGTQGTREILHQSSTGTARRVPCVAIGGINMSNVQRVMHQSAYQISRPRNCLNGVAVVSAIMAAQDPRAAARELKARIQNYESNFYEAIAPGTSSSTDASSMLKHVPHIVQNHASSSILCHNMTNTVVQNFAANVCLAVGASPIMSLNGPEAADLAGLGGALVINMGTVTPDTIEVYLAGVKAYNAAGNPVVLDPVGGGATSVRKAAIQRLLQGGFYDIIKGNEGEISAVAGISTTQQRGVDSGPSSSSEDQKVEMVKALALRERCIVLMTGATDYLSDGNRMLAISNGSHWLGKITGSGCALGSVIASYAAVHRQDKLIAVLAGLLHYEIAAEKAAANPVVKGPGTFIPAFLDELYAVRVEDSIRTGAFIELPSRAQVRSL